MGRVLVLIGLLLGVLLWILALLYVYTFSYLHSPAISAAALQPLEMQTTLTGELGCSC